jgi:hypothetical protein
VPGNPAGFSFFLPYSGGASQNMSALSPVSGAVTQFPANPMTTAGDMIYGGSSPAGTPERLGIGSGGQALTVSGGVPAWTAGMVRQAVTASAGFALQDATPTILSWTAPNDGLLHWAFVGAYLHASSSMTGGELGNSFTDPQGNVVSDNQFVPGGQPSGFSQWQSNLVPVQPGTVVSVYQATALTGGAAKAWAAIWGS